MEPTAAGQLVVASDIRTSLFKRALTLLDGVHTGLEEFSFGAVQPTDDTSTASAEPGPQLALVPARGTSTADPEHAGALVAQSGDDLLGRVLATLVQGRTNTARRAVDAVSQIHSEIDSLLNSFERNYPPLPAGAASRAWELGISIDAAVCQPSEEVLRMAAATTAAAARFRLRAAEAAQMALQMYDNAAKQAATAAQATTRALEMQLVAEQHSAAGNLAQALDAIRQANRLRDESVEAARNSQQLQQQYLRHRREAQEAHAQADAAMRHAYSLERDALRTSSETASRQQAKWKERYERLARQAEELHAQATSWEGQAEAAVARADLARQQADAQMAAGNYGLGNALMEEAIRAQEQVGYARAQATSAREAYQRLMPDVRTAREKMEAAELQVQELSQRQTLLQDATTKQRQDRLQEEVDELEALCSAAESAAALHEELVQVYEERLAQDQQQHNSLLNDGKAAEADALAVHISTWQELLEVARQNRDVSRTEATNMKTRLQELSARAVSGAPATDLEETPAEEFVQLKVAEDRGTRATKAAAFLARELTANPAREAPADPAQEVEASGTSNDGLLLQTELHHQRSARLAQQLHTERRRLAEAELTSPGRERPADAQAEALLDSMAVSHLVGTLETTRLLQLWKQRSDQAAVSAEEMRKTWAALEQDASTKADEAVRLEEQALALEHAGNADEAASTMARADELHRVSEQLRLEADKAKAVLHVREKAAMDAQTQSRFLVQGLHDVEHAAGRLQAELRQRGYDMGAQQESTALASQAPVALVDADSQRRQIGMRTFAPTEGSSAMQDEMATVMMASPSMLSRASSSVALNASFRHSVHGATRIRDAASTGYSGRLSQESGLITGRDSPTTFWDPAGGEQQLARGSEPDTASTRTQGLLADSRASLSNLRSGSPESVIGQDGRLAHLMQHLESHPPASAGLASQANSLGSSALPQAISTATGSIPGRDVRLASLLQQLQSQPSTAPGADLLSSGLGASLPQVASGDGGSMPAADAPLAKLMQQLESHGPAGGQPHPGAAAQQLASRASAAQMSDQLNSGLTMEFGASLPNMQSGATDSIQAHDVRLARLMQQLDSQGDARLPAGSNLNQPQRSGGADSAAGQEGQSAALQQLLGQLSAASTSLEPSLSQDRTGGNGAAPKQIMGLAALKQLLGSNVASAGSGEQGLALGSGPSSGSLLQHQQSGGSDVAAHMRMLQELLNLPAAAEGLAAGPGPQPLLPHLQGAVSDGAGGQDAQQDARLAALRQLVGSADAGDLGLSNGSGRSLLHQSSGDGSTGEHYMRQATLKHLLESHPAAAASDNSGPADAGDPGLDAGSSGLGAGSDSTLSYQHGEDGVQGQEPRPAALRQLLGSQSASAASGDSGLAVDSNPSLPQQSGGDAAQESRMAALRQLLGARSAAGDSEFDPARPQQTSGDGEVLAGQDAELAPLRQLLGSSEAADAFVGLGLAADRNPSQPLQHSGGTGDVQGMDARLVALMQQLGSHAPAAVVRAGPGLTPGSESSLPQQHSGDGAAHDARLGTLRQLLGSSEAADVLVASGLAAGLDLSLLYQHGEGPGGVEERNARLALLMQQLGPSAASILGNAGLPTGWNPTAAGSGPSLAYERSGHLVDVPGQGVERSAVMHQLGSGSAAAATIHGNSGLAVGSEPSNPHRSSGGDAAAAGQDPRLTALEQLLGSRASAGATDAPELAARLDGSLRGLGGAPGQDISHASQTQQLGLHAPAAGYGSGGRAGVDSSVLQHHSRGRDGLAGQDARAETLRHFLGSGALTDAAESDAAQPHASSGDYEIVANQGARLAALRELLGSGDAAAALQTSGLAAGLDSSLQLLLGGGAGDAAQDTRMAMLKQLLGSSAAATTVDASGLPAGFDLSLLLQHAEATGGGALGQDERLAALMQQLGPEASAAIFGDARLSGNVDGTAQSTRLETLRKLLGAQAAADASLMSGGVGGASEQEARLAKLLGQLESQASIAGAQNAGYMLGSEPSASQGSSRDVAGLLEQVGRSAGTAGLPSQTSGAGHDYPTPGLGASESSSLPGSRTSGGMADTRLATLAEELDRRASAAGSGPALHLHSSGAVGGVSGQDARLARLLQELDSQSPEARSLAAALGLGSDASLLQQRGKATDGIPGQVSGLARLAQLLPTQGSVGEARGPGVLGGPGASLQQQYSGASGSTPNQAAQLARYLQVLDSPSSAWGPLSSGLSMGSGTSLPLQPSGAPDGAPGQDARLARLAEVLDTQQRLQAGTSSAGPYQQGPQSGGGDAGQGRNAQLSQLLMELEAEGFEAGKVSGATGSVGGQVARLSQLLQQLDSNATADGRAGLAAVPQPGTGSKASGGAAGNGADLAVIMRELESQAAVTIPTFPVNRWDGHAALVSALRTSAVDEPALAAASSSATTLQAKARESLALVQAQRQRDQSRQAQLQEFLQGVSMDDATASVFGGAIQRCGAVAAASSLAEGALTLQVNSHGALVTGLSAYRRALAGQKAAVEASQAAWQEATALEVQANEARLLDTELLGQVQRLEAELSTFEAQGRTAQALSTRYELQRTQSKHAEAGARASQLNAAYEAAKQRAEQAHMKEIEANTNVETLNKMVGILAEAANEADAGVQHALEGYSYAVSALNLGAQTDLANLDPEASTAVSDADVQQHLERHAGSTASAQNCVAATRRLQAAADVESAAGRERVAVALAHASTGGHGGQGGCTGGQAARPDGGRGPAPNSSWMQSSIGQSAIRSAGSIMQDQASCAPSRGAGADGARAGSSMASEESVTISGGVSVNAVDAMTSGLGGSTSQAEAGAQDSGLGGRLVSDVSSPMSHAASVQSVASASVSGQHKEGAAVAGIRGNPSMGAAAGMQGSPKGHDGATGSMPNAHGQLPRFPSETAAAVHVFDAEPSGPRSWQVGLRSSVGIAQGLASRTSGGGPGQPAVEGGRTAVAEEQVGIFGNAWDHRQRTPSGAGSGMGLPTASLSPLVKQAGLSSGPGNPLLLPSGSAASALLQESASCVVYGGRGTASIGGAQIAQDTDSPFTRSQPGISIGGSLWAGVPGNYFGAHEAASGSHAIGGSVAPQSYGAAGYEYPPAVHPFSFSTAQAAVDSWFAESPEQNSTWTDDLTRRSALLEAALAKLPEDTIKEVLAVEAEMASHRSRREQELGGLLPALPGDKVQGGDEERRARHQELVLHLQRAEAQLESARADQSSLDGASPAAVQASHDRLQYHEQRIAMLQQALQACEDLGATRSALQHTHAEVKLAEMEAQHCASESSLLAKAAEVYGAAEKELEKASAEAPSQGDAGNAMQERLAFIRGISTRIAQRQHQIKQKADAAESRHRQLVEKVASGESAVELREQWLQQAQKAADTATATIDWEDRLTTARLELQELQAPIVEQQDKARAAAGLAQTMASAAAQHRKQAGDLARQAADQREKARRMAASGRRQEADAANSVAVSLQQQADGLLAQAAQMEGDAQKLRTEAQELDRAVEHAQLRVTAQTEVVEQVSAVHNLSVSMLQSHCAAATKLQDASQRQAAAMQQQQALAEAEKELAAMEVQKSGSSGGAKLRPDELATHMINVARAKQQASLMRTSLRAAQQQLEQDRDAAVAAAKQAAKTEAQRAQLLPRIEELEEQASAAGSPGHPAPPGQLAEGGACPAPSGSPGAAGAVRESPREGLPKPPNGESLGGTTGSQPQEDAAGSSSPAHRQSAPAVALAGGRPNAPPKLIVPRASADFAQLPESPMSSMGAARLPELHLQRSRGITATRYASSDLKQQRSLNDSGLMSPIGSCGGDGSTPGSSPHRVSHGPFNLGQGPHAMLNNRNLAQAAVVNAPLARLRLGAKGNPALMRTPPAAAVAAPVLGGAGSGGSPLGSPTLPMSRAASRLVNARDALQERDCDEARVSVSSARALLQIPSMAMIRQDSTYSGSMTKPGSPWSPDGMDGTGTGTAGALLDKVAGRSLRPMSHIVQAAGLLASKQGRESTTTTGDGALQETFASAEQGGDNSGHAAAAEGDRHLSMAEEVDEGDKDEEEQHDQDAETEPDTKMYRTARQQLDEVAGKVTSLRRQGDASSTAAELLTRKQEQLRVDRSAARGADGEQRAALLDHGDAVIRLKESEASWTHKQADVLEDQAAACQDALQYAVVDWHLRREVQRLEARCAVLTGKAQAKAVEAQGHEADAADALECITLATARGARQRRAYAASLEQQSLEQFINSQQARVQLARQRAAESRAEAAQLAAMAKKAAARRLLSEKKALCNKALYQSAVDLTDAYGGAAKMAGLVQRYRQLALKAEADALGERVLQLGGTLESTGSEAAKARGSQPPQHRSQQPQPEILDGIARLATETADAIQQYLDEVMDGSSDAVHVLRRRMDQVSVLLHLYQAAHDAGDYLAGASESHAGAEGDGGGQQQPARSEAGKRAAKIAAAETAVLDLDRACAFASDLRTMCSEAAEAHAALCDARSEPNAIQMQLLGQKAASLPVDQEEIDKQQHRVADLGVQVPLARDQLGAALQLVEYRQAAAQLAEAQHDLQHAAAAAGDAGKGLESTLAVRREMLAMLRNHMSSVHEESRIFTASGNLLQASAAEEAAERLAKDALAAETSLAALLHEAQLKSDEQSAAQSAAEELQQVAESSSELVVHLHRILDLQHEARATSRRVNDFAAEHRRLEQEAKVQRSLAEQATKDAELLQHESLQCRTNLKFAAADAHMADARQRRASAQQHAAAAATAEQAASAAQGQHKSLAQHQDYLLREIQLLYTAGQHLQDALSCMRDKHHLMRKLRDAEYQHRYNQPPVGQPSMDTVPELEVLQTQVTASTTTIQHHLASKSSYILAADHLHLATSSLHRAAECSSQAGAAMHELVKARIAAASTGAGAAGPVLLTDGRSSSASGGGFTSSSRFALVPVDTSQDEDGSRSYATTAPKATTRLGSFPASWQLQQAELRHRCLRGSILVLQAVAEAADRACEARRRQVDLSDQAASLVSDLAAKILEAEANSDEAAGVEAAVRRSGVALDEDDEESLKAKLMINALLQRAEAYRGEATALQGRIKELEEEERAAEAAAIEREAALGRLQADHRHSLEALDLTERVAQCREQEAALRQQARALTAEVATLEREASSMESKAGQLRQQLTSASHSASSEDVANLMLVMQQMAAKAAVHRAQQQQRRAELEALEAERGRLAGDILQMVQRAEHVLQASETQDQVRQASAHVEQLEADLSAAQAANDGCERMLDELRQQYEQLAATRSELEPAAVTMVTGGGSVHAPNTIASMRQKQQVATTQAAITLTEQMLETHTQRLAVLRAAVAAWEAAKQRLEAVVRHQEQLMQQAEWHATLTRQHSELQSAAAEHTEKARQLRADAGKAATAADGQLDTEARSSRDVAGMEATSSVRMQAASIRSASEAARQHALAEAEDALALRAAALASEVSNQAEQLLAAAELVRPMLERLRLAAGAAVSVARLQLVCVAICADQGNELTTMHETLGSVRDLASRIQGLLEAADRYMRAGQSMEAAGARGQASAVQEVLQRDLKLVRSCRQRLTQLQGRMQDAKQELATAEGRMSHVLRPAAVAQSIAEYVHQACELHFECADRQRDILRLLRLAADAMERAEVARREHRASQEAAEQLAMVKRLEDARAVERAALGLERSLSEAESERRLLEAQAVQAADVCTSALAAASLYHDLAALSLGLLQHMDELDMHREEHAALQDGWETVKRNLDTSRALLEHRRSEMEALGRQIEGHRVDAQALRKVGNDAQARVREEAVDMLTTQLAEITDDVVKIERRYASLDQQHVVLSSLHAKSEARVGLLSQLARLCSAGVGHLLDARDAHLNHASCMRNAAVSAMELNDTESAHAKADARVRELQESAMRLQREHNEVFTLPGAELDTVGDGDGQDPEAALRAANLARAELLMAQRQRTHLEQEVLVSRNHAAQADLAVQSSQLRITKARQRAEDAQRLAGCMVSLLEGSRALVMDAESLRGTFGTAARSPEAIAGSGDVASPAGATATDAGRNQGVLAATQLHSVTLQAMAEAATKFTLALDFASAAEDTRSSALASEKAAQAARDSAARQQGVVEELRVAAEGASVAQEVRRLHGISHGDRTRPTKGTATRAMSGPSWLTLSEASTAREAQEAMTAAGLDLERLQHEAAYLEATAAQEHKLVSCLEQQHALLRRASDSLLDMARFGIAADLKASPCMATAAEAASLLAACRRLSQQHAAAMVLAPPLECCKQAESFLRTSLECVQEARRMREQALGRRMAVLGASAGRGHGTMPTSHRTNTESGTHLGTLPLFPTAEEEVAAEATVLMGEHDQLLAEEERLLQQVQQLDDAAAQLLGESAAQIKAFSAQWEEASRPAAESPPPQHATPALGSATLLDLEPARRELAGGANTPMKTSPGAASVLRRLGRSYDGGDANLASVLQPGVSLRLTPSVNESGMLAVGMQRDAVAASGCVLDGPQGIRSPSNRFSEPHATDAQRELPRLKQSPGPPGQRSKPSGSGGSEIDADLVAMAAAAVARAKEAAAAISSSGKQSNGDRQRSPRTQPAAIPDTGRIPSHESGSSGLLPSSTNALFEVPSSNQSACQPDHRDGLASAFARGVASLAAMQMPHGMSNRPSSDSSCGGAGGPGSSQPTSLRGASARPEPAQPLPLREVISSTTNTSGSLLHVPSSSTNTSNSLLNVPSSSVMDLIPTVAPMQRRVGALAARHESTYSASMPSSGGASGVPRTASLSGQRQDTGSGVRQQPAEATVHASALTHEAPALPRLPLPDDLDPVAASGLMHLWSTAALHYGRAQHVHDGSMQQLQQQWERCQAQLQVLHAEEMKARSAGRATDADAVAATAAKWRHRAGRLQAALQRHSADAARYKALTRRATAMGERLQLLAAASANGSSSARPGASKLTAEVSAQMKHLVPRLPGSALAGCGVLESLDRLHGDLVQHVAALNAAAAGLQQQSQRLFSRASGRSSKLKACHGGAEDAAAYAAAMAKSQSFAEQAAAYGERAVELAAQGRALQELAERLSAESAQCAQAIDRLHKAAEQELGAQQALVQAVDLLLSEAMQAALFGVGADVRQRTEPGRDPTGPAGDLDSLLKAGHPPGACLAAARAHARRGEDLAQEAARVVQGAKEQLELRLGPFARCMEDAAAGLSAQASQRSRQRESLVVQGDAAALCVARARSKAAARQSAGDTAAAEKYSRAVEGWVRQAEKLRREASVAASDVEELNGRAQSLAGLGPRLRPLQVALDRYLDEQLEAWASAALSRVHQRGMMD